MCNFRILGGSIIGILVLMDIITLLLTMIIMNNKLRSGLSLKNESQVYMLCFFLFTFLNVINQSYLGYRFLRDTLCRTFHVIMYSIFTIVPLIWGLLFHYVFGGTNYDYMQIATWYSVAKVGILIIGLTIMYFINKYNDTGTTQTNYIRYSNNITEDTSYDSISDNTAIADFLNQHFPGTVVMPVDNVL